MYSLDITEAQQHVLLVAVMLSGMVFLPAALLLGAIFSLLLPITSLRFCSVSCSVRIPLCIWDELNHPETTNNLNMDIFFRDITLHSCSLFLFPSLKLCIFPKHLKELTFKALPIMSGPRS